jgi:hypothetical protein
VPFQAGRTSGPPEDFLTAFIADEAKSEVYGRPVGLAVLPDGSLLVADDGGNVVWRVTYAGSRHDGVTLTAEYDVRIAGRSCSEEATRGEPSRGPLAEWRQTGRLRVPRSILDRE